MAGKYHRTYLNERAQTAFEKMQKETGRASNEYFLSAVTARLVADGYLKERTGSITRTTGPDAGKTITTEEIKNRRRRVRPAST